MTSRVVYPCRPSNGDQWDQKRWRIRRGLMLVERGIWSRNRILAGRPRHGCAGQDRGPRTRASERRRRTMQPVSAGLCNGPLPVQSHDPASPGVQTKRRAAQNAVPLCPSGAPSPAGPWAACLTPRRAAGRPGPRPNPRCVTGGRADRDDCGCPGGPTGCCLSTTCTPSERHRCSVGPSPRRRYRAPSGHAMVVRDQVS